MNDDVVRVLVSMLGAGSFGAIMLRLIDRMFRRVDRGDDIAIGLRVEMRKRLHEQDVRLHNLESIERECYRAKTRLEAENRLVRQRFSGLVTWVVDDAGLKPPEWVYDVVSGPTSDEPGRPWQTRHEPPRGQG